MITLLTFYKPTSRITANPRISPTLISWPKTHTEQSTAYKYMTRDRNAGNMGRYWKPHHQFNSAANFCAFQARVRMTCYLMSDHSCFMKMIISETQTWPDLFPDLKPLGVSHWPQDKIQINGELLTVPQAADPAGPLLTALPLPSPLGSPDFPQVHGSRGQILLVSHEWGYHFPFSSNRFQKHVVLQFWTVGHEGRAMEEGSRKDFLTL